MRDVAFQKYVGIIMMTVAITIWIVLFIGYGILNTLKVYVASATSPASDAIVVCHAAPISSYRGISTIPTRALVTIIPPVIYRAIFAFPAPATIFASNK